jgi:hypothetical protein
VDEGVSNLLLNLKGGVFAGPQIDSFFFSCFENTETETKKREK